MSKAKNHAPVKKGCGIAYRIIAAIIAIACVAAFFLPFSFFMDYFFGKGIAIKEFKLYEVFENIESAPYKIFTVIPSFTAPDTVLGIVTGLVPYILVLSLGLAFIFAFISIFLGRKAENLLFLATIIFTWGAAYSMIAGVSITFYLPMETVFDFSAIGLAAGGTLAFLAILIVKLGVKTTILNSVRFLLTLAFTVCFLLALSYEYHLVNELLAKNKLYEFAPLALVALTILNLVVASMRAFKKKAFVLDFISSILAMLIAGTLFALSITSSIQDKALLLLCYIASLIALILFLFAFIGVNLAKKKEAIAAVRAETDNATAEKEQPVIASAPVAKPAPVVPEKDYFEGKLVDDFIETLDVTERNQFAALYLLNDSEMPEIPAYKVGSNNQVFFEMVFIMLGDYREKIPGGLLGKMYDYLCAEYPQAKVPAFKE